MAGSRIKGITIEIGGDATKLDKALSGVNKTLRTTQSDLRDIDKLLKLDPGNVELLKQKQEALTKATDATKEKIEKEKEALAQLKAADQSPEVQRQMEALERQIIADEQSLKTLKDQMKDFGSVAAQQMQAAGEKIQNVGDKISGVGDKLMPISGAAAAAGGALLGLGYNALQNADDLATLAQQTGLSTDEIQKMRYASDLVDVSFDDISGALRKMKGNMDGAPETWKKLGVATKNADGSMRDATEVFYETLGALSNVANETERDQLAMELFGKSADSLAGIVDDGGAALQQFGQEASDLGLIMSEDTISALNETNDTVDKMKMEVGGTLAEIGAEIATVLAPALETLAGVISQVTEYIRNLSPEQQQMILTIIAIVAAIGPLVSIIGSVVSGVGSVISIIGTLMPIISTVIATIGGPLLLAIGAAIAIGVLLYKNWDKICEWAGTLKEKISEAWDNIKEKTTELFNWVTEKWNALKDGISNAANAAKDAVTEKWNAMKDAVGGAMETLKSNVEGNLDRIKGKYEEAGGGIKGAMSAAMEGVKILMENEFNIIDSITGGKLSAIRDKFTDIFNGAKDIVKNALETIKGFFNFSWELPKLKMPHPKFTGKFSLNPPQVPTFSIDWYKKAYTNPVMFTSPTVLPTANGLKGFGDGSGAEIVMSDRMLKQMAGTTNYNVTVNAAPGMDVRQLADAVQQRLAQVQRQKEAVYA